MTLRQAAGGDGRRVHDLVEQWLDREDGLIVFVDRTRVISYAEGFGLSPCQLEHVTNEIARAVSAIGAPKGNQVAERGSPG